MFSNNGPNNENGRRTTRTKRALRAFYRSHSETYEEVLQRARTDVFRTSSDWCIKLGADFCLIMFLTYSFVRILSIHSEINDFVIPHFHTIGNGKHSIRYLGPYLWSKLNKDLREASSLARFRNKIRKLDFSEYISNNSNCCKLCSE